MGGCILCGEEGGESDSRGNAKLYNNANMVIKLSNPHHRSNPDLGGRKKCARPRSGGKEDSPPPRGGASYVARKVGSNSVESDPRGRQRPRIMGSVLGDRLFMEKGACDNSMTYGHTDT